jgi:hypothetical protein
MHVQQGHARTGGSGASWIVFAAFMLTASAIVNIVWGVLSLADDAYWGGDSLVAGHPALWGWVWIGFALVELGIVGLVITRNPLGLVAGIFVAVLNIAGHVTALDNFPAWALLVICADLLLIYALATPWLRARR